ncbi:YhcH/YjgK/YiaL family protein [Candidatus Bipolaricaulota bacterium]|nr:YhcH/YjgK/YiaL family protein [Candidatus Bipolaricaulota bacterium]
MILDVLENAHRYLPLNKGFAEAFKFLMRSDLKQLPVDKYEIDGDRVYAMVAKAPGRKKEDALLETHEKYIDIQLVLAGTDDMGWKPKSSCKQPSGKYNQETDAQLFSDEPDAWLSTECGAFAIFFPEDAHMPQISSGQLHRVIVKVAVDQKLTRRSTEIGRP